MTTTKTYYRVITKDSVNLHSATIEGAEAKIKEIGAKVSKDSEYFEYWQDQRDSCKIVKVTEVIEEI